MIATHEKSAYLIAEEEFACDHDESVLVRRADALGRTYVAKQCRQCGREVGRVKKNEVASIDSLPPFDKSLEDNWQRLCAQRKDEIIADRDRQRQERSSQWWRNYTIYLRSPEWKALRRLIMERDNYTCQGCMEQFAPSNLVCHHKSYVGYDRVGRTYGFEVETLCRKCHDEWHGINSDGGVRKSEYE